VWSNPLTNPTTQKTNSQKTEGGAFNGVRRFLLQTSYGRKSASTLQRTVSLIAGIATDIQISFVIGFSLFA